MKIAVLGAGFAGLAVTAHLVRYTRGRARIDLYDPEPIGSGPSGISLGLVNPYMGKKAARTWKGASCLAELHRLLSMASQSIKHPIVLSKGILRPASTEEQVKAFLDVAVSDRRVEWWPREASIQAVHGLHLPVGGGALYIKEGFTMDVQHYLQGLFRAVTAHGVVFKTIRGISRQDMDKCDRIIVCLGANSLGFPELKSLPMSPVKGQILTLKWPQGTPPLPMSLVGEKQIVMSPNGLACSIGSTYEHNFGDLNAHKEQTAQELIPKITPFFPMLEKAEIIECRSGVRASSTSRKPLIGKVGEKMWFFTGLGSRGLLQHAWLGKRLARAIISDDLEKHIPPEVLCTLPQQS
ncbi:MAG: FAD-binding oxidoreductase [Chlamydiales bacterium]|nr:FAD-binding oxidoreductase [Chlamydiales bacterium]